jgi:hypothetical protein
MEKKAGCPADSTNQISPSLKDSFMKKTNCMFALWLCFPSLLCAAEGTPPAPSKSIAVSTKATADPDVKSALKDPRRIVKLEMREPRFDELAKNFTEADLPAFFDILNKDDTPFRERSIAVDLIPHIGQKGDDRVVDQLLSSLKRPVKWENWTTKEQEPAKVVITKASTLTAIVLLGGNLADAVLKQAITVEGAQELTKGWISGWPPNQLLGGQQDVLDTLRGAAAEGLARNKATWGLVEAEYRREREACMKSGKESRYFSGLISPMALIDTIKEVGTLPDPRVPSLLMKNVEKYRLPIPAPKVQLGPVP